MSSSDPVSRLRAVALASLVLTATGCANDITVGEFGQGGATASSGGEAGAGPGPTGGANASGTTGGSPTSTGSGQGGAEAASTGTGEGGAASTGEGGAASTGAGEGGAASVCGGLAEDGENTCGDDAWCDYPDASSCGGDDSTGLCMPRPQSCSFDVVDPVCGCDGEVYGSECFAHHAGTDLSTIGLVCGVPCEAGAPCAGEDEYCQYPEDHCGFVDQPGVCVRRPTSCDGFPAEPVCGCDGETYDGACAAAAAGVDVWSGEDLCDPGGLGGSGP